MRRNWTEARQKVDEEGCCRRCGGTSMLEAAHLVPRSRGGGEHPDNIVPLCRRCHELQHAGRVDLIPVLLRSEQAYVVGLVGLEEAYRRLTGALV